MDSGHYDIQGIIIFIQTGKAIPVQTWTGPEGSKRLRLPEYLDNWYMKVVRFQPYTPAVFTLQGISRGTHFC